MLESATSRRLKFVFFRPHANIWFKNPVRNILRKQLLPNKYAPLFDYAINSGAEVYLTTALLRGTGLKGFIKSILDPLELLLWCLLNKISFSKVHFIFRKNSLRGKDVLFMMHYGNFTYETKEVAVLGKKLAEYLSDLKIYKVVHMTHYAYNPTIGAHNLKILDPDLLVAENNLSANSIFFNKFFADLNRNFFLLPYTPASKFIRKAQFRDRANKIVVTGSITFKMKGEEFLEFYGVDELQPLRRTLFENAGEYTDEMECLVSDLNASRIESHKADRKNFIQKIVNRLTSKHPQMNYYKKDIVATYNSYTMFAVPEEICDLPAIGFIEGMACGCAYFGLENPMYRDIGMIPNVHYVPYDGTVSDLMNKVRHYQKNIGQLEQIANCGYEFAINQLNSKIVYKSFIDQLQVNMNARA